MSKISGRQNDSDSDSSMNQFQPKKMKRDENSSSSSAKKLSEREREAELLKQYEERERLRHHEEIRKRLRLKAHSDSDNESKKKTDLLSTTYDDDIYAAEEDDDRDRSSTQRRQQINASKQKETQHNKILQVYAEERKKKQASVKSIVPDVSSSSSDEDETPQKTKQSQKLNVKDVYNSTSSDDDDHDRSRIRSRSPEDNSKTINKRATPISNKSELKSMVLTRFRMEKWCHAPFFADVAKGAFVRINIGQNNGVPVYRICEIRDVVETAKVYNLGSARTNRGLRLKHGDHERVFRLEFVSNRDVSDSEFNRWREALLKKGLSLPSLEARDKKMEQIERCKQYVYNNREISKIAEENRRFRKAPVNYAVKKIELLNEIAAARDANDSIREKELQKKLGELQERMEELDQKRTQNISSLAEINRRNRKKTIQNVEMALLRGAQEQRHAGEDPFTRSRCAPVLVSKAPQTREELLRESQIRRAADEAAAKKKAEQEAKAVPKETPKEKSFDLNLSMEKNYSSVPIYQRGSFMRDTDHTDDLFVSHNFELDIPLPLFHD